MTVALVVAIWLAVFAKPMRMPWLLGTDPYTRLFYLDRFVVTASSNPWLPGLQALLLATSKVSDTIWAYRGVNVIVGLCAMVICWLLVRWRFGAAAAAFSLVYFFLHRHWAIVTVSVYMEPLFVLFASAAGLAFVTGRRVTAAVLFVLATYTRPEGLIAAPGLALVILYRTRSWRSAFSFALLFVPVLGFYVYARFAFPHFAAVPRPPLDTLLAVAKSFVSPIARQPAWAVVTGLAVVAVVRAWRRRTEEPALWRDVVSIVLALGIFCGLYAFVIPFFHDFRPPSSPRKAVFSLMGITLLAATLGPELTKRTRWATPIAAGVAFALALSVTPWRWAWEKPDFLQRTERLRKVLAGSHPPLCFCAVPDVDDPTNFFAPMVEREMLVQLRWQGRSPRSIDCAQPPPPECGSLLALERGRPEGCADVETFRNNEEHLCLRLLR